MLQIQGRRLIVITGPVGAGKSTTSLALAQSLRRPDVAVAVIDLDQIYCFVRQQDGYGEPTAWVRARQGAAALADCLFNTGMSVVIVDGEFFTAEELDTLTVPIQSAVERSFFTLQLSYEIPMRLRRTLCYENGTLSARVAGLNVDVTVVP